jgi:hypothetical protein
VARVTVDKGESQGLGAVRVPRQTTLPHTTDTIVCSTILTIHIETMFKRTANNGIAWRFDGRFHRARSVSRRGCAGSEERYAFRISKKNRRPWPRQRESTVGHRHKIHTASHSLGRQQEQLDACDHDVQRIGHFPVGTSASGTRRLANSSSTTVDGTRKKYLSSIDERNLGTSTTTATILRRLDKSKPTRNVTGAAATFHCQLIMQRDKFVIGYGAIISCGAHEDNVCWWGCPR